ncbi:MAG TPA: ATP-binding protein [Vicinamibacterales bacterium]|nr:ATP-binding protein [Vicinamibacterales bacterium]
MMRIASSLTNRIFLASTLLAVTALGFTLYFVNARVSAEAEAELRRGVNESATLVERRRQDLKDTFTTLARSIADLPTLKSAVDTGDPPTVQPFADEFRRRMNVDLLLVMGRNGAVLGKSGAEAVSLTGVKIEPTSKEEIFALATHTRGLLQVISVPLLIDTGVEELLGRLSVGFFLDDAVASRLRELTGSEVAFTASGEVLASSLPPATRSGLRAVTGSNGQFNVTLGGNEYLALAQPMVSSRRNQDGTANEPMTLVLRSRTERLRVIRTLRAGLAGTLVVTILLATVLSYLVARTVTRPLAAVTSAMREVAATGDLTRKVSVRSRAWDDEDARLLATAFNTLTDSIARFQREAAQKDRLTSLGRLSTVIAHEIRNPLMIIRASLASLWSDDIKSSERREALADIDEETKRLNRIVTEVLDFSKPIRFELGEAQVNDICRASSAAAWAGSTAPPVQLDLDPGIPPVVTDAERLRTALINILTNARHASEDAAAGTATPVVVSTRCDSDRIAVTVRDRGNGITAEDMTHIFDPFFTTRRAGTGLGLPIAKNIIDGLGGSLSVESWPENGTEIRIELPLNAVEPA